MYHLDWMPIATAYESESGPCVEHSLSYAVPTETIRRTERVRCHGVKKYEVVSEATFFLFLVLAGEVAY